MFGTIKSFLNKTIEHNKNNKRRRRRRRRRKRNGKESTRRRAFAADVLILKRINLPIAEQR
jgi:hypothetical protein